MSEVLQLSLTDLTCHLASSSLGLQWCGAIIAEHSHRVASTTDSGFPLKLHEFTPIWAGIVQNPLTPSTAATANGFCLAARPCTFVCDAVPNLCYTVAPCSKVKNRANLVILRSWESLQDRASTQTSLGNT